MKRKKKLYRMTFTTRKDFSFLVILHLLIIAFLFFFLVLLKNDKNFEAVISLVFVFLFFMLLFNNKIVLEKYYIRVYFGIFWLKIKYKDIRDIYISDNHYNSFASSYHKVGIKTSRFKSQMFDTFISPFDREDFISEVNERR